MLIKLIVKILGGVWKIKGQIERRKSAILNKVLERIYFFFLEAKGSYIGINSKFKDIPAFPHGLSGIFISSGAEIGRNCIIFHQVTIGSNMLPFSKNIGSPTIGNNVYIGCGAKIIGGIKVGDNCRIGANCVITESIPDNCVIVLNKPRIIKKKNLSNKYYSLSKIGLCFLENGENIVVTDKNLIEEFKRTAI